MSKKDVYIVSAARTPVGKFGGGLASVPATELGSIAIRAALQRAEVPGDAIDEVYMGCVLTGGIGQAPARQSAIGAGVPPSVPTNTINKVCGSGLQSVILAARGIMLGETDLCVVGGMENMSATAYALLKARTGYRMGNDKIVDMMVQDGLWDVYNDIHMGSSADFCAAEEDLSRQEQDDYAVSSYNRANKATAEGLNSSEIAPVTVPQRKGDDKVVEADEGPAIFNEEKLRKMKPAFEKNGTVTAGNASSINDAGSALVIASEDAVKEHRLRPIARIVSWGFGGLDPKRFPLAPPIAVRSALDAAGMKANNIDYWEINEAFAIVPLYAIRELDIDPEIVNYLGGAISIGHPIGCSGARILTTLLNTLTIKNSQHGLATLCIGGGESNAMIVERV